MENFTDNPAQSSTNKAANLAFAVVIIVIAIVGGKLFLDNVNSAETGSGDVAGEQQGEEFPDGSSPQTAKSVGEKLGSLILVNKDEVPTVATIVNIDDLQASNPDFYGAAKNGDKLVVYSDKAIIFREEDNLIINVLPVERVEEKQE